MCIHLKLLGNEKIRIMDIPPTFLRVRVGGRDRIGAGSGSFYRGLQ
jgi:hypothetical protein